MAFFRFRWLRRLVRRNMSPIEPSVAEKWHKRLTFLYFFLAWNTLGVAIYLVKNGELDYAHFYGLKTDAEANRSKAVQTIEMLGIPKAKIYTLDGLSSWKEREYENPVLQEQIEDIEAEGKLPYVTKI